MPMKNSGGISTSKVYTSRKTWRKNRFAFYSVVWQIEFKSLYSRSHSNERRCHIRRYIHHIHSHGVLSFSIYVLSTANMHTQRRSFSTLICMHRVVLPPSRRHNTVKAHIFAIHTLEYSIYIYIYPKMQRYRCIGICYPWCSTFSVSVEAVRSSQVSECASVVLMCMCVCVVVTSQTYSCRMPNEFIVDRHSRRRTGNRMRIKDGI